jgi:hypothetical protein
LFIINYLQKFAQKSIEKKFRSYYQNYLMQPIKRLEAYDLPLPKRVCPNNEAADKIVQKADVIQDPYFSALFRYFVEATELKRAELVQSLEGRHFSRLVDCCS